MYKQYLIRYITETREKGANPILLTSITRRNFNEYGTLIDTHGEYPNAMREVARDYGVPLIDLQLLTEQLVLSLGETESKSLYLIIEPGEYENYPEGRQDNTHLKKKGAYEISQLVANEIIRQKLPLQTYLLNQNQD
jgi:hypothetical protein